MLLFSLLSVSYTEYLQHNFIIQTAFLNSVRAERTQAERMGRSRELRNHEGPNIKFVRI